MKAFCCFIIVALGFASQAAEAQTDYPSRPITIIVPFAAGSGTDTAARVLTAAMAPDLKGATFVIDNRPGANGIIAASAAAKSDPDGYTLFLTTNTTHSVNPYIYKQLPYDPNADFVPVGLIGETAPALLTAASNPANSVQDVVELAKRKPGELNFASTNTSSRRNSAPRTTDRDQGCYCQIQGRPAGSHRYDDRHHKLLFWRSCLGWWSRS